MKTNTVKIGGFANVNAVNIGGSSSVAIQTMWKDCLRYSDLEDAANRIKRLGAMGCRLLRFAVPDLETAQILGKLAGMVSMPLVADIHFDHRIALRCMDFPIAKIRINPGNIGSREKVAEVLEKASGQGIPIRIGVNSGSLPGDLEKQVRQNSMSRGQALVEAARRELAVFEESGFDAVLVSMKASEIADTVIANRILSRASAVPLHLGVTEAGPLVAGVARSSAALAPLLCEGIGDTIRVSLSDSMENEVIAAREICAAAREFVHLNGLSGDQAERLPHGGVRVVSCPRCGRHGFDTHGFMARWLERLYALDRDITVAVMGCEVNGPGEARHADIGITGGGNKVLIFRRGSIVKTVSGEDADKAFADELDEICNQGSVVGTSTGGA